jgi:hypothetical protein
LDNTLDIRSVLDLLHSLPEGTTLRPLSKKAVWGLFTKSDESNLTIRDYELLTPIAFSYLQQESNSDQLDRAFDNLLYIVSRMKQHGVNPSRKMYEIGLELIQSHEIPAGEERWKLALSHFTPTSEEKGEAVIIDELLKTGTFKWPQLASEHFEICMKQNTLLPNAIFKSALESVEPQSTDDHLNTMITYQLNTVKKQSASDLEEVYDIVFDVLYARERYALFADVLLRMMKDPKANADGLHGRCWFVVDKLVDSNAISNLRVANQLSLETMKLFPDIKPSAQSLESLLRMNMNRKLYKMTSQLYQFMEQRGKLTAAMKRLAVDFYIFKQDCDRAFIVLLEYLGTASLDESDGETLEKLMGLSVSSEKPGIAMQLWKQYERFGIKPSAAASSFAIQAFASSDKVNDAMRILTSMQADEHKPSVDALNDLLKKTPTVTNQKRTEFGQRLKSLDQQVLKSVLLDMLVRKRSNAVTNLLRERPISNLID